MKKVLLVALVICGSVQAEQVASSNGVDFYVGASAASSWTSSDFNMDYKVNKDDFLDAKPWAKHKKSSIGRVGAGFHAGVKKRFGNGLFIGGEFGYTLSRAKHHHDFTQEEDLEDQSTTADQIASKINIKHGDELALALKLGKDCKSFGVYGIVGVTTKDINIEYALDKDSDWIDPADVFDVSTKDRVWGAVFGLGGSKKITDKISCSLEYKYKLYNDAKESIDCRVETKNAFGNDKIEHDESDRHFKVKSDKHEISLGITFNI